MDIERYYTFEESAIRQISKLHKKNYEIRAALSNLSTATKSYCGNSSLPTYMHEAMREARECLQKVDEL